MGTADDRVFFDSLKGYAGAGNMAFQVDSENDPVAMTDYFKANFPNASGYGNGTALCCDEIVGPNTPISLDHAVFLRTAFGKPEIIPYAFTVSHLAAMDMFIRSGLDGLIVDTGDLDDLKSKALNSSDVCLAMDAGCQGPWDPVTPFLPSGADQGYGLEIRTSDSQGAGTDSNITFTLHGQNGTASATLILSDFAARFSAGVNVNSFVLSLFLALVSIETL